MTSTPRPKPSKYKKGSFVGLYGSPYFLTLFAPIERIKIVLQTQPRHPDLKCAEKYEGIFKTCGRLIREQPASRRLRILSLWKGNFSNIIRTIPQSLNFAVLFTAKAFLTGRVSRPKSLGAMLFYQSLSGAIAGAICLTYCFPFDLIRTRIASDVGFERAYGNYPTGMIRCFSQTIKNEGFLGLYKGFGAALAGVLPYRASYFGFFALGKSVLFQKNRPPSFFAKYFLAQTTSLASMYLVYPLDTVRKRMMISGMKYQRSYPNCWACFKNVLKEEGWMALYAGAGANLIKVTGTALLLTIFDTFESIRMEEKQKKSVQQ